MKRIAESEVSKLEVAHINSILEWVSIEMNRPYLLKQTPEALNAVHSGIQVKEFLF